MTPADKYFEWYRAGADEARGVGEFFEAIIHAVYRAILEPGNFALDGGANRGLHTFPIADCIGPRGRVIAVEAIPGLAADLSAWASAEERFNISVVSKALGACEGETPFVYVRGDDAYSGRFQRIGIPEGLLGTIEHLTLPMTTIDAVIRDAGRNDLRFIKLDLEGGEFHALQGAMDTMRGSAPLIIFENGRGASAAKYDYGMQEWFDLFERAEYKTFDLFGRRFGPEQWDAAHVPWYFIGARRDGDLAFVADRMPDLIAPLL